MYVWSVADQPGSLSIITDDAIELSIKGQIVLKRSTSKAGGFAEPESISVTWRAGWNPVAIKLLSAGPINKLTLKAGGEGLRTAAMPEK